jgi:glycine oxidase
VVFVGGGVIGLASAWQVARLGIPATVVDPSPGHGASWMAAGMLAPVSEAEFGEDALTRLLVAGAAEWPAFADELGAAAGRDVGYRRCGTLVVAVDPSDRAVVDQLIAFRHRLGLDCERMAASRCRSLVPALSPDVRGGAHVPGDHQVDNRSLVRALLDACRGAGVTMIGATVAAVEIDGGGGGGSVGAGSVGGVLLDDGRRLQADAVVIAAGSGSARIGGVPPGVLPPVRPVKGVILRLGGSTAHPLIPCTVRGLVHGRAVYLVPRDDGSMVVGATSEESGLDVAARAGDVHSLLDDARTLVPDLDHLELLETGAGLRPGSPDNAPFIGWTAVAGLAVAAGHFRNGILLTPLTARTVAALVSGGPVPEAMAPFGPGRPGLTSAPGARGGFRGGVP